MPLIVLVAAVLNVALNIVLIPRMGAIAAAYTTLVAYAAMVIGSLYFSQRHYPIVYEYRKCLWLIIGMIVLAGLTPLFSNLPLIPSIIIKLLILCVYPPFVLAVGVLRRPEIIKGIQTISVRSPLPISTCLNFFLGHRFLRKRTAEGEVT
jgi:O-antigen/teichoic acid export membrane protein